MSKAVLTKIEEQLNCTIIRQEIVGGGCIAQTSVIKTDLGQSFFLKQGFSNTLFKKEANGLRELHKAQSIGLPNIIMVDEDFLLLEYIEEGNKPLSFFSEFGRALANQHKYTSAQYGFYEDNFIGSTPQINTYTDKWLDFYFTNRLLYQYKLTEANGYSDASFCKAFLNIEKHLPTILSGSEEAPSICHGDLWAGNYMVNKNGKPVLVDPAVYYGHRETDLAMTKLFGGFSQDFYTSYQEEYPLNDGYLYRENIYVLYHVLNHLNLFGTSYKNEAMQLMMSYQNKGHNHY